MKHAVLFSVLSFALFSGAALADCRGEKVDQTASSCLPGTAWDETTATCVDNPTSLSFAVKLALTDACDYRTQPNR